MASEGIVTGERQSRQTRLVDMWIAPGLNPTNIDILSKLKSAEDRQFSKNMAVTGKVYDEDREKRGKEETHLIGIRSDTWKPSRESRQRALSAIQKRRAKELKDQSKGAQLSPEEKAALEEQHAADEILNAGEWDIDKARLVLKMFRTTGSNIRWRGSIEELCVSELQHSLGSKVPLLSFAVILPDYEYVTHIQQDRRFWRIPPAFSFAYYQEATDRMWYVDLLGYWVSLGIDFHVEAQGRKIGKIDGSLLSLGVNSRIHVYEPSLAEDAKFVDILSLFAASIGYQRKIRRNIRRRVAAVLAGKPALVVDEEEMWLHKNPRRMAR